ncbi:MAG: hypothetical protein LLF92_04895 [Planctomycetaceae bacterium]|nr:hypothetical protein [Planctomycetaceae bacterium]
MLNKTVDIRAAVVSALVLSVFMFVSAFGANALQNTRYSYSSIPDGGNVDTNIPYPTKLSDGLSGYNYPYSVEWFPTHMPNNTLDIDFRLGTSYSIDVVMSYWLEIQQSKRFIPAVVEVYSSSDRINYTYRGIMTPVFTADNCVGQLALKLDTPITDPYLRIRVIDNTISQSGVVSLLEVEAYQENFLYDDLALGTAVSYGGTIPNGTNTDGTGRRVTDGTSLFDQTKSVQWNFGLFGSGDSDPYVYIKLPRTTTLKEVFADFMAKTSSNIKVPTVVNISTRMNNESNYTFRGSLNNVTNADGKINRFVWTGTDDTVCDWVLLAFTRSPLSGIVSLTEMGVYGDEHVSYKHNAYRTAGVMTINCGVDAFYRPDGYVNGAWTKYWQDPSPDNFDEIVRVLHDVYGYNTLFIEWNGEVDWDTALQYYQIWADACAKYNVEMVPVIGLVQWDYCLNVNPSALYQRFYDIAPLIDVTNIDARNYFRNFVGVLLTQIPSIKMISPIDINVYAQARGLMGTIYSGTDVGNWINSLMTYAADKEGAVLFQQPVEPYNNASWLSRCQSRLCDTYCYLLNDDYATLQNYIFEQDSVYGSRAEGDLVIVDDYGNVMDSYKQVSAANVIEAAGGELSIDNCVTSIVAKGRGEYFWYNMLKFGRYVGKWESPMEVVGTIFRRHHGVDPDSYQASDLDNNSPVNFADFALLAQNWFQSGSDIVGDIDQNGIVDFNDLSKLAYYWLTDNQ